MEDQGEGCKECLGVGGLIGVGGDVGKTEAWDSERPVPLGWDTKFLMLPLLLCQEQGLEIRMKRDRSRMKATKLYRNVGFI